MHMGNNLTKAALATLAAGITLLPAHLQADGTLGSTSNDSIQILILKDDSVRISALEDVDFESVASMVIDASKQEPFCVFASNGNYKLTGSTAVAAGGLFQMRNGTNTLDYQLDITAIGIGVPDVAAPMTSGVPVLNLPGNTLSDTCLGTPNAILNVVIAASDFNAAAPGQYTDTLTMFVEPE